MTTKAQKARRQKYLKNLAADVKKSARLAINKTARNIHRRAGGEIPKKANANITGYRRVRAKRTLSTVKNARRIGRVQAHVFMGTNRILARYGKGKIRQVGENVVVGKRTYPNSFIITGDNGFKGVFYRNRFGKVIERSFEVDGAKGKFIRIVNAELSAFRNAMKVIYDKERK